MTNLLLNAFTVIGIDSMKPSRHHTILGYAILIFSWTCEDASDTADREAESTGSFGLNISI